MCIFFFDFLFPSQCQRVLTKSISSLANPVTFIHDHPYSDLHKYCEYINYLTPSLKNSTLTIALLTNKFIINFICFTVFHS